MSTNVVSAKSIKREWKEINADGKILGRLATEVATILMGKDKAAFVPYMDLGDYVVITNASKVKITGKKAQQKTYVRHSGYPGGKTEESYEKVMAKKPEKIIEHAIKGMLPKNKLGAQMIKKLKVFAGAEHPYSGRIGK